jgi:aspartate/methionine/tyrosine aminotransferase
MSLRAPTVDLAVAQRVAQLGTETVFAVSAEAAALAAQGKTVYPFHLGDLNLATPENIVEASLKAIRDGKTTYCPNAGIPQLRDALAADVGGARGLDYAAENVSVQPGGKPVIAKFLLTLMDSGDEVLYPNPGFPIYGSLIDFFGGVAVPYGYLEGPEDFHIDIGWRSSSPGTTCSCCPTRPTSTCASRARAAPSSRCPACASAASSSTRSPRSTR